MIKKIHQTWKNKDIPYTIFQKDWIDSWKKFHPDFEYILWTDEDNRNLIKSEYPQYLDIYDSQSSPIKKTDLARCFILHKYGGLYIDLDSLCVKSLIPFMMKNDLILSIEPKKYQTIYNNNKSFLSNVLMYSIPQHPFWDVLFNELKLPESQVENPIFATGPGLITRTFNKYNNKDSICVLNENTVIWNMARDIKHLDCMTFVDHKIFNRNVFAIHINTGVWWKDNPYIKIYTNQDYIRTKKENLKKNLSYVFTCLYGNPPPIIKSIFDHNKKICDFYEIEFKIIKYNVEKGHLVCGTSDWLRTEIASQDKNVLYVDWDCRIDEFPDFDSKQMMCGSHYSQPSSKELDMWAFYNGNHTDVFKDILNYIKNNNLKGNFGSYFHYINQPEIFKQFQMFDNNFFNHLMLQTGRNIKV